MILGGIGNVNQLPWKSKVEMDYFRKVTTGNGNNAVVMGRKTFESLKYRPLKNRRNYIFTRDATISDLFEADVIVESNIENILLLEHVFDEVYIIGGAETYRIFAPFIDTFYVTRIHNCVLCDTFFPVDLIYYHEELLQELVDEHMQLLSFYKYSRGMKSPYPPAPRNAYGIGNFP
jgi:dihydrofolate reductase